MVDVVRTELPELRFDNSSIVFVAADWWKEASHFVLLRYTVNGSLADNGVRMDLDKQAILDDAYDGFSLVDVRSQAKDLWTLLISKTKFQENISDVKESATLYIPLKQSRF